MFGHDPMTSERPSPEILAMHLRQLGRFVESEAAFVEAIKFSSKFPSQARAFHDTAVEQLALYRKQD